MKFSCCIYEKISYLYGKPTLCRKCYIFLIAVWVAAAESFVSKGAWVSTVVLMEATWVLTAVYDLTHAEIATAIDMLLHHRDLTIQESDSVAAALEQYRNRPALGFSDCLILETAGKPATFRWEPSTEISPNSTEPKDCSSTPLDPSESTLDFPVAVNTTKRWRPELRRAMIRVCPECFSWSVQERERYGVNPPDKARQKLDRALMKELFGPRIRSLGISLRAKR